LARPYLEKPFTKKVELVKQLNVKALSSSPSTGKKKKPMNKLGASGSHL
jgi:hypothetical protein